MARPTILWYSGIPGRHVGLPRGIPRNSNCSMISRIFVGQQRTSMFFKNPSKNCKSLVLQDILQKQLVFFQLQAGQDLAPRNSANRREWSNIELIPAIRTILQKIVRVLEILQKIADFSNFKDVAGENHTGFNVHSATPARCSSSSLVEAPRAKREELLPSARATPSVLRV